MISLAITGATGRMGKELIEDADSRSNVSVDAAFTRTPESIEREDCVVADPSQAVSVLEDADIDVLIDFTVPEASREYLDAATTTSTPVVIGTTGFDEAGTQQIETASRSIPVLKAANFARGIQTLFSIISDVVAALPEYDIELTETHHNGKRDAPSGTANQILEEIEATRDIADRTHGRSGHAPRQEDNVGVHALRAGNITGIHELLLAGNHEELRITHRAEDRGVFAAGAVDAAVWLADQPSGRYDFQDVLAE